MDIWGTLIFIAASACVVSAVGVLISAVKHRFSPRWGRSLLTSLGVFVCTSVVGAVASADEGPPSPEPTAEPGPTTTDMPSPAPGEPSPTVSDETTTTAEATPPPLRALMPVIIPIPDDPKAARRVARSIVDHSQHLAYKTRSCKHRDTLARAWKTLEALPQSARSSRRARTAARRIEHKRGALLRSCETAGLEQRVQARIDFARSLPLPKAQARGATGAHLRVHTAGPEAATVLAQFDGDELRTEMQRLGFSKVVISADGIHHIKELSASSDDGLGLAYLAEVGLDAPLTL